MAYAQKNVYVAITKLCIQLFFQTEKEIEDLTGEIDNLEMAKAAKNPPMMVVQTRLENRTQRPNVELCRDQPQYDMVEEIAQIQDSVYTLQNKLDMAR